MKDLFFVFLRNWDGIIEVLEIVLGKIDEFDIRCSLFEFYLLVWGEGWDEEFGDF